MPNSAEDEGVEKKGNTDKTREDLSTGPTSLIGLLTGGIIADISTNSQYTPSQIASAIALMIGVYGMILGFLKLGFLLEFVSIPIITGFISAVAITIILNQMGSLFGTDISSSAKAYTQIRQVFELLPQASGITCAIGFSTIVFLTILDQAGKRWGDKSKVLWLLSITRAFLALVVYTSISYAVNHNLSADDYLFNVVKVKSNGQEAPTMPSGDLISKVAVSSLTVFIGATIEHTAIARAFGVKNNYVPDQSQELCYFGVVNFINSLFHAMGVGGAMSRTSVNSSCKVKSPLSGLVTTAIILVCIYELVGTLYWIPKATLAGIIICAVWPLIVSISSTLTYCVQNQLSSLFPSSGTQENETCTVKYAILLISPPRSTRLRLFTVSGRRRLRTSSLPCWPSGSPSSTRLNLVFSSPSASTSSTTSSAKLLPLSPPPRYRLAPSLPRPWMPRGACHPAMWRTTCCKMSTFSGSTSPSSSPTLTA